MGSSPIGSTKMKCSKREIISRLKRKAQNSSCRYRIAAIGLDFRGNVISLAMNSPRFEHHGGGLHAEMAIMRGSPRSLRTIIILRIGASGIIRPIHPCLACARKAKELGISIKTIEEE